MCSEQLNKLKEQNEKMHTALHYTLPYLEKCANKTIKTGEEVYLGYACELIREALIEKE